MNLNVKIYSTSPKPWFSSDFADIKKVVAQAKGGGINKIDVEYIKLPKLIPVKKYSDGDVKPSQIWFKETLTDKATGYNVVILHCSEKERNRWGVSKNIGGTYHGDNDETIEFWFCADEGQKAKNYKGKSEFWRRFLHELSHGHERFLYGKEVQFTHHYDYDLHALPRVYNLYDWTYWDALQARRNSLRLQVADMLQDKAVIPLPERYWTRVTQGFGVPNAEYPTTRSHIGVDFGCPVGTAFRAPWKGEILESGTGKDVGHYGIFKVKGKYLRLCHLFEVPVKGVYQKGDVIAFTGNTGKSTGPHLHLECWKQAVDLALLDKIEKVFVYLENPLKFIV